MVTELSPATQDYLKAIYHLNRRQGEATTSQIASWLDVRPASVTGMLQKLAQTTPPLVYYQKHQGATLTEAGERAALEMVRHHRLLELFLHEMLGYTWDEVHEEADKLEHVISEEMEERMAAILGHPERDPHGDPIPNRQLELAAGSEFPLNRLKPEQRGVIRRVRDDNPDLLQYLDRIGLRPGVRLTAVSASPFDQLLTLQIDDQPTPITLGAQVTGQIFVDLLEETGA